MAPVQRLVTQLGYYGTILDLGKLEACVSSLRRTLLATTGFFGHGGRGCRSPKDQVSTFYLYGVLLRFSCVLSLRAVLERCSCFYA